jgi:hypothetical protein
MKRDLTLSTWLQEVEEAVQWIKTELIALIRTAPSVSLFETTIRILGGILATTHLKNDADSPELLKPAVELAGTHSILILEET